MKYHIDQKTATELRVQHLLKALKQCNPISESLKMRLFERLGCNLN
jgi:hypothetical protein